MCLYVIRQKLVYSPYRRTMARNWGNKLIQTIVQSNFFMSNDMFEKGNSMPTDTLFCRPISDFDEI